MAKKKKEIVSFIDGVTPGLFGQKYSSRDYRYEDSWGKINSIVLSQLHLLRIWVVKAGILSIFVQIKKMR